MARKMKKFSAGGAQGRYDRRMADIKKDFAKDSAGKSGKALEVLEAKRAQRIADAEDDRAKRMGTDRTATRKAEYDAEKNLSRTRKFGADKPAAEPAKPTAPAAEAPKAKPQSFGAAFKEARSRLGAGKTFTFGGKSYTTNIAGEGRRPVQKPVQKPVQNPTPTPEKKATPEKTIAPSKFDSKAFADLKAKAAPAKTVTTTGGTALRGKPGGTPLVRFGKDAANDPARAVKLAALKKAAEAPGASGFAKSRYEAAVSSGMYAKGGTVKKETTMDKKKKPAVLKRPMPKEPITGGANTVPLTPERKEFLKEMAKRNAKPGMAKGGKATKFGKALVKKSADTMGRAMPKFAKGGSIDGCAIKGKTKTSMVKMARGGAAKMRGRDNYGGANFKNGGSC